MGKSRLEVFLDEEGINTPAVRKAAKRYLQGYHEGNGVIKNQARDMLYHALGKSPMGLISALEEQFDGSTEEEGRENVRKANA
jgi:hypothetical protein